MNELIIKTFEDLKAEFEQKLIDFGSQLTNRKEGGAYDLQIRVLVLMLSDAYQVLKSSIDQVFPSTATGAFLDLHAQAVGLEREEASRTNKVFICRRDSDSGVLQIPVGDVLKSPVVPSRGQLRFRAIAGSMVDKTGTAEATGVDLVDTTANFIDEGVAVGTYLFNSTDGSYGQITEVQATVLKVVLIGGALNSWTVGDAYKTQKPSSIAGEFTSRTADNDVEDLAGALLTDNSEDDFRLEPIQIGQKIWNITSGAQGIISSIGEETLGTIMTGGSRTSWLVGDEYKLQPDLEISIICEANQTGADYNNIEVLLGRDGEEVEFEIDSGFTGVDEVVSNGEDLVPGADEEVDAELRIRIANRWKELARGSTRDAYINFARSSSPAVYDANAYKGDLETDVKIVLSGPPGSRNLANAIGVKVYPNDNFDSLYTDDGTAGGIPALVGIQAHEYIRARAPLTDMIYLFSVEEVAFNIAVEVKVIEGFVFDDVKLDLLKRLRALFLVERTVDDVEIMKVGEELLLSRLNKIAANTDGIADFTFTTPDPGTNDGDTDLDDDQVFSIGTITITEKA